MAISNVNTNLYSIGKGGAQILDTTSGAQQGFAQILARQQAQRQQELKQLTDQQVLLKPDGLRNDADRQDFFKQAQDWKQKAIDASNETNPYKKSLLKSQADQAYLQAQDLVNRSKQQAVKDNQFQQFAMNNATRHQLTDDAVAKGLANANTGVNSPGLINDYSILQRAPDIAAFEKRVKDLNENRLNNTQENYKLGPLTAVGNTKQTPITKYKQADAQTQALDYLNEATINPEFANVLQHKYPQIYQGAQTEQQMHEAHALASAQLVKDNPLYKDMGTTFSKQDTSETDVERLALFKQEQLYRQQHPSYGQAQSGQPLPFEHNYVAPIQKGGLPAIQKILSLASPTQFREGEKPIPTLGSDGMYKIDVPDQTDLKKNGNDIIKANKQAELNYNKSPSKTGNIFSSNRKIIPWKESDDYKDLISDEANNPYVVKKTGEPIYMDPSNPIDIQTKAQILADRLHIPVDKINTMLGGTGKHGLNSDIKQQLANPTKTGKPTKTNPLGLDL